MALSIAEGFAWTCGFKRWMNLVGVLRPNWWVSFTHMVPTPRSQATLTRPMKCSTAQRGAPWGRPTPAASMRVGGHTTRPLVLACPRRRRPHRLSVLALGDPSEAKDSRLSYPSGHSAYMFFSMTALMWYLVGKLHLLSRPSQVRWPWPWPGVAGRASVLSGAGWGGAAFAWAYVRVGGLASCTCAACMSHVTC